MTSSSGDWMSSDAVSVAPLSARASRPSVTPSSVARFTLCGAQLKSASHSKDDELRHAVPVDDGAQLDGRGVDIPVPVDASFEVLRRFGHEVGIGEAGVVEIVERRRLEARRVAGRDAQRRREAIAVGDGPGRLAAVLVRIVVAQIRLQRVIVDAHLVDAEQRIRVALRDGESGVGREMLLAPLEACGQHARAAA